MNWKVILLVILTVALLALVAMFFFGSRLVQGFQTQTGPGPAMNTFTMYYADWCPHCQTVKPEFTEFSKTGPIEVNGKPCQVRLIDAAKNPEAAKGKPVKGFPTFLYQTAAGETVEYSGPRTRDGWMDFLGKTV